VTRTDLKPTRPDVREYDATKPLPADLVGRFDTVIINNPRHYVPDLPKIADALVPGGRIIVQGRAAWPANQKEGFNPEFDQLFREAVKAVQKANPGWTPKLGIQEPDLTAGIPHPTPRIPHPDRTPPLKSGELPGGLAVRVDLVPGPGSEPTKPAHIAGGPFFRTTGETTGGGPNARIVYWKK